MEIKANKQNKQTYRSDFSLDKVLLVYEVEIGVGGVHLLANHLHRDQLKVSRVQKVLYSLLDQCFLQDRRGNKTR